MFKEERPPQKFTIKKFECQTSCGGMCCKVPKGEQLFVFLTKEDRQRIAAFIKQPVYKFAKQMRFDTTRFKGKGWQWFLKSSTDQCRFLKEGRCSIYEARPTQCRTWPFWPENMNQKTFDFFAKACPGIGVGVEISKTEITNHLNEQREADAKYTNSGG